MRICWNRNEPLSILSRKLIRKRQKKFHKVSKMKKSRVVFTENWTALNKRMLEWLASQIISKLFTMLTHQPNMHVLKLLINARKHKETWSKIDTDNFNASNKRLSQVINSLSSPQRKTALLNIPLMWERMKSNITTRKLPSSSSKSRSTRNKAEWWV